MVKMPAKHLLISPRPRLGRSLVEENVDFPLPDPHPPGEGTFPIHKNLLRSNKDRSGGALPEEKEPSPSLPLPHRERGPLAGSLGVFPRYLPGLLLFVLTVLVYWQTGGHGFINFDDTEYLYENPYLKLGFTPAGIKWAFTTFHASNWHPLTWLSHLVDVQCYGMHPFGHHITGVIWHAANALLLFWLLVRLTGLPGRSLVVAALFALHPLHVESVAWAAERKDLLCAFFGLATLFFYAGYAKGFGQRSYLLAIFLFACGLMAKPMLVTLPMVMLLLDFWPLRRGSRNGAPAGARVASGSPDAGIPFKKMTLEKIPFLVLAVASCAVTLRAQREGGALSTLQSCALPLRIANAINCYSGYLFKMFWPENLAIFYPLPKEIPLLQLLAAAGFLTALTCSALYLRRDKPFLLFGWSWYLVTLLPVIGLVQVGGQSSADRYTYLPLIGVFVALVWCATEFTANLPWRRTILASASVAVLTGCTLATLRQLSYWQDNVTLYTHALAATRDNYLAHNNLGTALMKGDNVFEARAHFNEAVRISPGFAYAWLNLGENLLRAGDIDNALVCLGRAIDLKPNSATAYLDRGVALFRMGRSDVALNDFNRALDIEPFLADGNYNKGIVLSRTGRTDEAIIAFSKALRISPDNPDYQAQLVSELARKKASR